MPGADRGTYRIRCVKVGGVTLTHYGQYVFAQDDEIDLLDQGLPATIRCGDWQTADNVCRDVGFEIAQRIVAGEFVVTEKSRPQPMKSR